MSLQKQIKSDIVIAMKAKQSDKLNLLRVLSGELNTNEKRQGKEKLSEVQIIRRMSNNAKDLGNDFEVQILDVYLPKMHGEPTITLVVKEIIKINKFSSMGDMGKVMKEIKLLPDASLFDGKITSNITKKLLG